MFKPITRDKLVNISFVSLIIIFAILLRISVIKFESGDYIKYLSPWYDFIKSHGRFHSLIYNFSNYTPPYLYLLTLVTFIPLGKILSIKILSILFDFLLSFATYLILKPKFKEDKTPLIGALSILFLPTVFINSALWGQSDAIYVSFILFSIFFLFKRNNIWASIFYGIAIAFKLQAIFFAPIFLVLILKEQYKIRDLIYILLTYISINIPILLIGKPIKDTLFIYFNQSSFYPELVLYAPNIYQFFPSPTFLVFNKAGLILTGGSLLILLYLIYLKLSKITNEVIIQISLLFALIIPFLLPKMHERYFFLADVLSFIYAYYFPKRFFIPILIQIASLVSYTMVISGDFFFNMQLLSIFILAAIIAVLYDIFKI